MTVSEILEDKFEVELRDFLNNFQIKNECKIEYWSWTYNDKNNYTLRVKIDKQDQNLIN